jgi:hypothetical protein
MTRTAGLALSLVLSWALAGGGDPARAAEADAAGTRKVKITWREVKDAVKYELQLSHQAEMDPLVEQKSYTETSVFLQLKPGTYYFRVRGFDKADAPGPWSDVEGFVVNPTTPQLLFPADKQAVTELLPEEGLTLKWAPGLKGTRYMIQVADKKGMVLKRWVDGTELQWKPAAPGEYRWRIGFESAAGVGEQWGPVSRFTVAPSAFPPPPKPVVAQLPPEKVGEAKAQTVEAERSYDERYAPEPEERPAEWFVIGRVAQAVAAYSNHDGNTGLDASGAAFVGLFSAEVRWRDRKRKGQVWTLSGSLNFELIRQAVLDTDFSLPRAYGRVFYGREYGKARYGGLFQLNAGYSAVFLSQGVTAAKRGKVLRKGFGVGGVATYRASQALFLSALGLVRLDSGGHDPAVTDNPLETTMGWEAGFGIVLGVSERLSLEGRLRGLQETFRWKPSRAGATSDSTLSDTFVIIDVGLGWKL